MRLRILFSTITVLSLVSAARNAGATENFPPAIAAHLKAPTPTPPCTTCHTSSAGGRGTVTSPFGEAMRSRGLRAYDEASLRTALDALAAEKRDSDEDGTLDIDELKAGTDPNAPAGGTVVPEYGCGIGGSGGSRAPANALALALAAMGLTARRRARGRTSPRPSDRAQRAG